MFGRELQEWWYFPEELKVGVPDTFDEGTSLNALERHLTKEFIETG